MGSTALKHDLLRVLLRNAQETIEHELLRVHLGDFMFKNIRIWTPFYDSEKSSSRLEHEFLLMIVRKIQVRYISHEHLVLP